MELQAQACRLCCRSCAEYEKGPNIYSGIYSGGLLAAHVFVCVRHSNGAVYVLAEVTLRHWWFDSEALAEAGLQLTQDYAFNHASLPGPIRSSRAIRAIDATAFPTIQSGVLSSERRICSAGAESPSGGLSLASKSVL